MKNNNMMSFIKKQNTLFSVFLALGLSLASIEGLQDPYMGNLNYIKGMSPFSTALMEQDQRVFLKVAQTRTVHEFIEEQRMFYKIKSIITRYQKEMDTVALNQIPRLIYNESKKNGFDPLFLTALIATESSFDNSAKSNVGALGLMQIKPRTGWAMAREARIQWGGEPTLYQPDTNIALGAFYLSKMVKRFKDMELALEAYNHGPSQLTKYLRQGKPPYKYSSKVYEIYDVIRSNTLTS